MSTHRLVNECSDRGQNSHAAQNSICARIGIEVLTMKHRASACRVCEAYKQVSGVRAAQALLVSEAGILPLTTQELNSRAVGWTAIEMRQQLQGGPALSPSRAPQGRGGRAQFLMLGGSSSESSPDSTRLPEPRMRLAKPTTGR